MAIETNDTANLPLDYDLLLFLGLGDKVHPLVTISSLPRASPATPSHPGLGDLGAASGVNPALEGLLLGVALGTVGRDRLKLPLEALEGRETGSRFFDHTVIVLHDVPVRWHKDKGICM